ncbi:hypothetical protein [Methanoregula formicica]|uniref:Uncharacterized protein n=1 Tax=Methanoregula formicica (strain DSM 22288 / NBRC 105244 / SMSP) TaxID=593750 RepID=L0HGR5_METFS|nr:hypothetical protein [Methanoregula formicica]AGB02259.1 hypothetical protein Metfor_1216 [Methanoregula formicica SMSP]
MNQHQVKCNKKKHPLIFLFVIAISLIISVANAGAPPPEYRVGYMLPVSHDAVSYYPANMAVSPDAAYNETIFSWDILAASDYSVNERFMETDYLDPVENPHPESPFPLFPVLSGYWRMQKYIDFPHSMTLISLDWYCDDNLTFTTTQTELIRFLSEHGSIENSTIDLSSALVKTKNPYLQNISKRQVTVMMYESDSTSGYFIFHNTPTFPGEKLRISYYGTTGSISYWEGKISDYGVPGTASLKDADEGIRDVIVKKIFNLVDANPQPPAYWGCNVSQDTAMPFFPDLSPYRGYKKMAYLKNGNQYVSEVWFFNDISQLVDKKQELLNYLKENGNVTDISIAISDENGNTSNHWNVTQYESRDTSGFFTIYETTGYPGTNLYILYYGVIGSSDIRENISPLKSLIRNVLSPSAVTHSLDSPHEEYLSYTPESRNESIIFPGFIFFFGVVAAVLLWRFCRKIKFSR